MLLLVSMTRRERHSATSKVVGRHREGGGTCPERTAPADGKEVGAPMISNRLGLSVLDLLLSSLHLMFSSWFHGRQQPPCSPPAARTTVTVRTEHVEVIGGGSQTSIDYSQLPLLPPELVIQIILAAADSILQDSVIPPQDKSRHLLRLASVNLECYKAILSHTLLKNLVLSGLSQTQAFQQSLDDDRLQVFRDIVGHRLTRLVVDHHQSSDTVSLKHQHALFDSVTRQQDFDKAVSIRPLLQHCHSLQELHLETTPRLLCEKRRFGSMDPNLSTWLEFSNDVIEALLESLGL
jgi:hypothetical protein